MRNAHAAEMVKVAVVAKVTRMTRVAVAAREPSVEEVARVARVAMVARKASMEEVARMIASGKEHQLKMSYTDSLGINCSFIY